MTPLETLMQSQSIELKSDEVLVVGGPATLTVKEGKIKILGRVFSKGDKIVVHTTKSYSIICVDTTCNVEVTVGGSGFVKKTKLQEDNIYYWEKAANEILSNSRKGKKIKVIIIGDIESGKTSLTTLIANHAYNEGFKVAVIDADVGQADIGPPTCISLGVLERPILRLSEVAYLRSCFVGSTTPCNNMDKLLTCISKLLRYAQDLADIIVIDTDGWIKSTEAIEAKINIIKLVDPDYVIILEKTNDIWASRLKNLLSQCKRIKCILLPTPTLVKTRNREFRKTFREHGYSRFLKDLQLLTINLDTIKIINSELFNGTPLTKDELDKVKEIIGVSDEVLLYGEKLDNKAVLVFSKRVNINNDVELKVKELLKVFRIEYKVKGFEQGIIVGLFNEDLEDLGIGVIESIDFKNRIINILAPRNIKPALIAIGQIKLAFKENMVCEEYRIRGKPL